ncbi:DUF3331 domain-containing protein [Burkholderia sp. WSM2232]|uniref:DUF3331 domain-containing protein n=1 Tax=Burkholderia sp. WSM2232 TaxID=944436 RepID=UPI00040B2911
MHIGGTSSLASASRNPARGSYGNDFGHVPPARSSGVCAISAGAIRRGDLMYQPARSRPSPLNGAAMIFASALCEVEAS